MKYTRTTGSILEGRSEYISFIGGMMLRYLSQVTGHQGGAK